ncbi:hypothetical protein G6011_05508 [Alternaria panax]|uniref:Uncharacterized protein n=1 Tax=Alternaria panax TaxID=48097 RepID=A0AAD4FD45_9PLEO|nr:hypothetical protein G6011_05508 [Alternaria panax]
MSGPFRFQAEEARSPLDRSASPFSAGQPVSFKTNVNRAKTKKWVQAKKNAYDGDDWGDYDEYDEYGVNQEPQQPQAPAPRYYAQRTEQPSRSFTDPSQQAPLPRGRRNSFEHGEEQRAFSSTTPHAQHNYSQQHGEPRIQTNVAGYSQGYDTRDRGDFSPSAMPPPLQTRISQVPADFTPPINTQFPPRKSSIGQGDIPMPTSPRSRQGSQSDKPLPFVRPADIYKRHEEERQRASLDSSRPSLDSPSSPTRNNVTSPTEGGRSLQPLETVAERRSEYYLPDYDAAAPHQDKQQSQQDGALVSPHNDQGLRSVVDQAFTRADENRSVPPTPISNDNDSSSDLLRSNTGSTSGISPIMSRVPSSAASALRNRNQEKGNTPAIAEEPSEATTPITQPTSANVIEPMHHVPRKPSPGHNRNFSNSSIPRSGLATPTRGDSPARSPVLAPSRDVPEPESALVTTESNETSDTMEGGLKGPSSAYATREADIATAAKNDPGSSAPALGAAELRSQDKFLESHNAQSPVDDALSRDRSESPSKGRVQALANKFGEVASPRRGSTQSTRSRNSVQSWERSNDNSRAGSPTKASHSRHSSPVKEFRPHLPGQWESYATTAMTPSDHGEQDRGLGFDTSEPNSLNNSDLTPTMAKHPVAGTSSAETETSDPIAALKDAGAAMVNSIRTTLGAADDVSDTQQQQGRRTDHGNVYLPRPLQLDRTVTSNSSAPPTPPAKNTPQSEFPPPAPLKDTSSQPFTSQPERPSLDPQLSTDPSAEDQESDRLRKEIVASLSPFKAPASPASESNRASLQPVSPGANRASSILPSEYDTYWAEEDRASRRSSQGTERYPKEQPSGKTVTFLPQSEEPTKPIVLNRFSWEASGSQSQTPDEQAQGVPTAEPTKASPVAAVSPPVERAIDQGRQEPSEPLPDSYFGPDHTFTVTKPDPISDTDMPPQPSSPPPDPARSLTSPFTSPTREGTRSPGLHVVNTELNPEAVDLPPRFSAEHEPSPGPKELELSEKQQPEQPAQHPAIMSPTEDPTTPIAVRDPSPKSPTTDKPLGAREIATLATAAERIHAYNATREYWAKYDHGLSDWLCSTLEANPDLAIQTYPVQRVPTSSARHRHTGSLALFSKLGGSSSHDVSVEQHNNASVPVPANATSPTTGAPSGSGFGGRTANQQMQLKGKDLLHTANLLGGKGMTSAKGLFAKGKSRFGREKASHARADSAPSSREASEEPELVIRRSRASTGMNLIRSKTEKEREQGEDAPNEEKKKRRFSFSSQFRRASRSRSRPSSVALPKDTPSVVSSTPKTSPPRDLHHYLMGERRPHTFHAPESWVGSPPTALNEYFNTTPPRRSSSQSRLGILPSPAKSAFSNPDKDTGGYVPPVPPIPDEVTIKHYRRRSSQDSASHRMLQSVVRHSTPPIVPNRHSMPAAVTRDSNSREHHPVFAEDDLVPSAQERADDYKTLLRAPEGSFQPDLPTAESGDLRRDDFQFGFSDEASQRVKHDDIDDDDQPPRLNHDPLPASSQLDLQQPFMYTNKHMDVSDEDSDKEPVHKRGLALLPALDTMQKADNISPVLHPVGPLVAVVLNQNDEAVGIKHDEGMRGRGVVRYEDTPFVLTRQQPDDGVVTERPSTGTIRAMGSREFPQSFAKQSLFEPEHNKSTQGHSPIPPYHRVNELSSAERRIVYGDRASDVESPVLGLLDDTFRTSKVQRIASFEAEVVATRDATPTSDASPEVKDDQITSKVEKSDAERAFSPVWFTKSDLQLPNTNTCGLGNAVEVAQVRATTLTKERNENATSLPNPSSEATGEIAAPAQQQIRGHGETSLSDTLAGANAAAGDSNTSTRRISTPPSRGVDAVEEHSASDPVDTSWNHRYSTIELRIVTGDFDKMRDESDRVTPVAQVPRITQNGPETPKAEEPHNENAHPQLSNGYSSNQANFPDFKHQAQQLQVSNNVAIAPERSRSMLSQISAMVSDDGNNQYSQTSTGRSTPSTIRRMQPDYTMKSSAAPPQIPEEVLVSFGSHTANSEDDDFDLYADHNGVVRDVQDKSGQPLRLADLQVPGAAPQPQPSRPSTSDRSAPASRDGERPRYSFERPMSFISGPEDQDGKPQDQINQASTSNTMQVHPIPEQHQYQSLQSRPMETVYSMNPPPSMASPSDHITSRHQLMAPGPSPSKNIFQAVKSIDPGSKMTQPAIESWRPSGEPVSQQVLSENSNVSSQPPQTSQPSDRGPHEPQGRRMVFGQTAPHGAVERTQGQKGSQQVQAQAQVNGPRNQFELHQQTMQWQAQYPRPQDENHRPPTTRSYLSAGQEPKQQEKSSKPRLASIFKNLGGKAQANSQHPLSNGNTTMSSESEQFPLNPSHGAPVQSVIDRFTRPREMSVERPIEQPRSFVPPNRPSMGQQPQFIQTPLTVPPADLHRDPRKPITSAASNDFPPQQPPSMPHTQAQPYQVPQSGTSEHGKKKRFSAFGALFNRGGASGNGPAAKHKLSKEGKKAQKTQQSSASHPTPPLVPQWIPQQDQPYKSQQSGLAYYPPGQLPPHTVQNGPLTGSKLGPSQLAQSMHPQGLPQQYQQAQEVPSPQKSISNTLPEEGSAFLKTKQLAMEHQARQSNLQSYQAHNANYGAAARPSDGTSGSISSQMRYLSSGPPPGGYYNPRAEQASAEQGAYAASLAARQQGEQRRQQQAQHGAYPVPQAERQHERQQLECGQNIHRDPPYTQQPERQVQLGLSSEQLAHQAWLAHCEQLRQQEQHAIGQGRSWPNDDARVQQLRQQQDNNMEQRQPNNTHPLPYHNASDPRLKHSSQEAVPISLPPVSPMQEPRYDAPPIPAAYNPVSGAFVSPLDQEQQPLPGQFHRQDSEPGMQALSPQVSAQSPAPPNGRSHSDASTVSIISPISNSPALPNSSPTPGGQRHQKPRMSSISEVHQQDRPWHLNFPEGATEQDIVRARQGQYMQQRFTAQQQQQAERAAGSPSPRASPEQTTPTNVLPHTQVQGGGFRELLPRSSSRPYSESHDAQSTQDMPPIVRRDATPVQPTPIRPGQSPSPATYPLPMSPDPTEISSPVNSMAGGLPPPPPPKVAHSPVRPGFGSTQPFSFEGQRSHFHNPSSRDDGYDPPPRTVPHYDEQVPDEAPPSYDGPGVPNDGMNKSPPEAVRPPNMTTDLEYESRGRQSGSRPRQASIGILQHPQPASMAASPQRTSLDMGAESLRRQLLQQANLAHMERVQREQEQRERQERERQEREAARARARELERSASGGGQVPSLRSVGGSTTGGPPGCERHGSHVRQVFELPAVEDDEPTMKATSYPGQEWVPPMWDGD